jgi:hypothetical protein
MAGPVYGGQGVTGSLRGQPTNVYSLEAGTCALIPSGTWFLECGPYCAYQEYDIITGIWRSIGSDTRATRYVRSDGANFRVANQSGCVIGALLTNKGSGYTSVPTVTDATTGATYLAILGPVVNTSVTVNNGGTNYTYPPQVAFSAPPQPGIQATGHCTLAAGVVTSVTVDDQGAGYTVNPTITFINDPREGLNGTSVGSGAAATATTTGAQTVGGILVLDSGNPVTSLPTITPSGGGGTGAAATAIMCWAITAYTVTTSGTGYTGVVEVTGLGGFPSGVAAYTNPTTQANLLRGRRASILAALATTFANITATGQTVYDGGVYPGVPSALIVSTSAFTTAASLGFSVGGVNDSYRLFAA